MKKERQVLEDNLNFILKDYSSDKKIIEEVTIKLATKGIPRGRVGGMFTQVIPLSYVSEVELCLFTKLLFQSTHEVRINPEQFFNEIELTQAEMYQQLEKEKIKQILLHNVDQINENQWLCTKETYQSIAKYFENGLLTYNSKTQRQPLKRKVGQRIIEVINIDKSKVSEIKELMAKDNFYVNALTLNVRKINGMERIKYNSKERTLLIEPNEYTFCDVLDGAHRILSILKLVEEKPDIDRLTSIYIYHINEETARAVIKQQ